MLGEYYDLVAGLPLISLQGGKDLPDYAVLISHLETLLSPADRNALRTLRLPYDNSNVATLLLGLPRPFDSRGNWSEEALKKELEKPDEVPPYLAEFISSRGEGGESRLDALFYEWIVTYPSQWIVSWFSFELHMRGFLAVLMRRKYNSVGGALEMPDIDELVPRIKTSSASDCGLSQALPGYHSFWPPLKRGPSKWNSQPTASAGRLQEISLRSITSAQRRYSHSPSGWLWRAAGRNSILLPAENGWSDWSNPFR